jgi:hypothetical protein
MVKKKKDPKKQVSNDRLAQTLSNLKAATSILLAKAKSDSGEKEYDIRLGESNTVYCNCGDFRHRNPEGGCKHIKRFKKQFRTPLLVTKQE